MALFNRKKSKVVDWTERLQKQRAQTDNMRSEINSESSYNPYDSKPSQDNAITPFPFFAGASSTSPESSTSYGNTYGSNSEDSSAEEKRRKLGKRLLDMTNKIEDLTKQIYRLQQRIEVLERRSQNSY